MTRRVGAHAVRDAGSTTGVATAVLALLSAGTLATLGVVTAGDLRDLGRGPAGDARQADVGPPSAIPLTPSATPSPRPGAPAGGGGSGSGGSTGGVQSLPDAVPGGSSGVARPELSGVGATPDAAPTPETPAVEPTPTGPVFTGVTPAPGPGPSVLGEKKGKHLGRLKKLARPAATPASVARPQPADNQPRGRAVGHRHGQGRPAVVPVGPAPVATPSADAAEHEGGKGPGHGKAHGARRHGPADLPLPLVPLPAPTSGWPQPVATPPGRALGHSAH